MGSYYLDDNFDSYPPDRWLSVLNWVLPKANYVEINHSFSKVPIPGVLLHAEVPLPNGIQRVYSATHRFYLTPEVAAFFVDKPYWYFDISTFEDVALYKDDTLVLGTITHEDYVVMLLNESERQQLNQQGLDFWCEWNFN